MRAKSIRANPRLTQHVSVGEHRLTVDEPEDQGGDDAGPSPEELLAASLASCTAITMEMYAKRKGWDAGEMTVDVQYEPAQRGSPTRFVVNVIMPKELPEEQRERLMQIAAKCPVHRTLESEVMFDEKVTLR
jgi:putative redox protein